jgi:hypothetical protein
VITGPNRLSEQANKGSGHLSQKGLFSAQFSYIQAPGKLSTQLQPSRDGHETVPPEGFEIEASKGLVFPSGGFFI